MDWTSTELTAQVRQAADLLRQSKRTVALTGAGISTSSGIPDFRSTSSGLWNRYDPFKVASLTAFRHQPENFFAWMQPLAREMCAAEPNPAHLALAELQKHGYLDTVITQNIDCLHQRAGSANVLEIHGSLESMTCIACYRRYPAVGFIQPYLETGAIPHCPDCLGILKPDVILFEEQLPYQAWQAASTACKNCDLLIIAGSSLEVMPVAGLPMLTLNNSSEIIILNNTPTYLDVRASLLLRADLALILPLIAAEVINGA